MKASSEVVEMDVKTRIMTIRLMDRLQNNPVYTEVLGMEFVVTKIRWKENESHICHGGGLTEM